MGYSADSTKDLRFDTARFVVPGLYEFWQADGRWSSSENSLTNRPPKGALSTDLEFSTDSADYSISFSEFSVAGDKRHGFFGEGWLTIRTPSPLSYDEWYKQYFYPIGNLVSLSFGKSVFAKSIHFANGDTTPHGSSEFCELIGGWGDLKGCDSEVFAERRVQFRREQLLPIANADLFQRWLRLCGDSSTPLLAYFGTIHNRDLFAETVFLDLARTLESISRSQVCGALEKDPNEISRNQRVLALCPEEDRSWLSEVLQRAGFSSFRAIVHDMLVRSKDVMDEFIADRNLFITNLKATRDAYAHHNLTDRRGLIPPSKLHPYIELLRLLILHRLLESLLCDTDHATRVTKRSKQFYTCKNCPLDS